MEGKEKNILRDKFDQKERTLYNWWIILKFIGYKNIVEVSSIFTLKIARNAWRVTEWCCWTGMGPGEQGNIDFM